MAEKGVADQGSLAITARSDGNRWYGRVSIPDSVAKDAGFQEGVRISARCCDGRIIIQQDDKGPIKFPAKTGKGNPRHAFEAATTTLGLKEMILPQTATKIQIEDGKIILVVAEEYLASVMKPRKKTKKEPKLRSSSAPARSPYFPVTGAYGAAAAVLTDANRAGKQVRPMGILDIINLLKEHGKVIQIFGPRMFKINSKSATISDLLEAANEVTKSNESNKIILIAD
jgi:hypothetical protein